MIHCCPVHGFNLSDCPVKHKRGNTVMVTAYDQGKMLDGFLASFKENVCCLQMRADCMHLALALMRQWRSIATSVDLASLVLLASFQALGKFGGVKLIKPKSPFCDKFKVDCLSVFYGQSIHLLYESGGKRLPYATPVHYLCMPAVSLNLWASNTHAANLHSVHVSAVITARTAACRNMQ